jgi:hypothetical protein
MGLVTIEGFVVTDDPVDVYGGVRIDTGEIPRIAEQIRNKGLPTMPVNHDERVRLKPRVLNVDVRNTDSGSLGVWIEFEIDEETWRAAGDLRALSISTIETYKGAPGDPSKPLIQVASDAAHWDDDLRDEVAVALSPHFNVNSGRLYQFNLEPPAKIIVEFGVPLLQLIQSVGINVFSSALWDGLKLFWPAGQSKRTFLVFSTPGSGGRTRLFVSTPDREVAKHAVDKLPEIANSSGSAFHYDEQQDRWEEEG